MHTIQSPPPAAPRSPNPHRWLKRIGVVVASICGLLGTVVFILLLTWSDSWQPYPWSPAPTAPKAGGDTDPPETASAGDPTPSLFGSSPQQEHDAPPRGQDTQTISVFKAGPHPLWWSIVVPPSWTQTEDGSDWVRVLSPEEGGQIDLGVLAQRTSGPVDLEAVASRDISESRSTPGFKVLDTDQTTVDGLPAYRFTATILGSDGKPLTVSRVYVATEGWVFLLDALYRAPLSTAQEAALEGVFASFRIDEFR